MYERNRAHANQNANTRPMIRAYLANGTLAAPADTRDSTMTLDSTTWAYLSGILGADYCYLVVGCQEVVKVMGLEAPNIALVQRNIDGTRRRTWPNGTSIAYSLTEAEINDAVTAIGNTITVAGALTEDNGVIAYEALNLVGIGGCTVHGDDEGIWMIQSLIGATGRCSIAGESPPPIPPQYLNLRAVTEGYYRTDEAGNYRAYL